MAAIFISYRRSDGAGHAGRLRDRLTHWYDDGVVFYDVESLQPGEPFPARLVSEIAAASVVLVVIGPDWLAVINERAAQPAVDVVRGEIEQALVRLTAGDALTVLPLLFGGAAMPASGVGVVPGS